MEELYALGTHLQGVVEKLYRNPAAMELEFKEDSTPLTIADRTVNRIVGTWRDELFPELAIISEEGHRGERTGDPEQYWMLVDEIDGTWAYSLGVPVFTSLLALMRGSEVAASVIVDPVGRRIYSAERGKGAFLNKERIRVYQTMPKTPTVGIVSWPKRGINDMLIENMVSGPDGGVSGNLHRGGCVVVGMGTIGYLDALVASGQLSATIFPGATLHDTAAGDLMVREAGGTSSDLFGMPLEYGGKQVAGHIFSCDPLFLEKMLTAVNQAQ